MNSYETPTQTYPSFENDENQRLAREIASTSDYAVIKAKLESKNLLQNEILRVKEDHPLLSDVKLEIKQLRNYPTESLFKPN